MLISCTGNRFFIYPTSWIFFLMLHSSNLSLYIYNYMVSFALPCARCVVDLCRASTALFQTMTRAQRAFSSNSCVSLCCFPTNRCFYTPPHILLYHYSAFVCTVLTQYCIHQPHFPFLFNSKV